MTQSVSSDSVLLPHVVPGEFAQRLLESLGEIMMNGYGELHVRVENGRVFWSPALQFMERYEKKDVE